MPTPRKIERMDSRTERVVKNEAVFREVNERINEVVRDATAEYHCECGHATCTETIPMTVADYEDMRTDSTCFAVLPGHEIPDLEDVVKRSDGFFVVRKEPGAPAELAAKLDPRS
jgi:hypothetical protein